ncbi:MAG: orotidine-5'-phosphate decarboxylase [Chloroflexi bacterium]|nr:orotidine-5'-phosphate decarboxylase [Chloroflexota bacterium]
MSTGPSYLDRLAERSAAVGTVLCLGIDPDPEALPEGFRRDVTGVEAFATLLIEAAAPFAAAVKPNLAFFEAFGSPGLAAFERVRAAIPSVIPVVIDAKRGDIGTTSARHAAALYDALGADAITVSPYLGEEAIRPLLERADRLAYVLCRTSNPGAGELQDLPLAASEGRPAEPLWARVAARATSWGPGGTVGLVVGATAPRELEAIRALAPGLPFLVPGVGAQGGEVDLVLAAGPALAPPAGPASGTTPRHGGGLLVNVSRGIAAAATDPMPDATAAAIDAAGAAAAELVMDLGERLAERARSWAARLPVLR